MLRSMFSGITGLESFQTFMDVVGNNIANVNTVGFKGSRVNFQDLLYQTLSGGGAPNTAAGAAGVGGTNPVQVGLGTQIASIQKLMGQGAIEQTGNNTDLAIQGNGFFIVQGAGQQKFTRAGDFTLDAAGNLVDPNGDYVQGWVANSSGVLPSENANNLQNIQIPLIQSMPATATANVNLGGNLSASLVGSTTQTVTTVANVYDSLGNQIPVTFTFTPPTSGSSSGNQWSWKATVPGTSSPTQVGSGTVTFGSNGQESSSTGSPISITTSDGSTSPLSINVSFQSVTQSAGPSTLEPNSIDGNPAGNLTGFSIDPTGTITGSFSNGLKQTIAQIALAAFSNPSGLLAVGGADFEMSPNADLHGFVVGTAGTQGFGNLIPGALEQSNVDLSQEFTNMILAERSFQANAQVINASDTLLQTLTQLR